MTESLHGQPPHREQTADEMLRDAAMRQMIKLDVERRITPKLNAALSALQGELPTFTLDDQRTVEVETKGDKPNYSYKYVTLGKVIEKVAPLLAKHGLSFSSWPGYADPGDGKIGMCLTYVLAHSSGEERRGVFPIKFEGGIQQLGGALTYIRRYAFAAALNIAVEQDDDGMSAMLDSGEQPSGVRAPSRARQAAPARSNRREPAPAAADALPGGSPISAGDQAPRALLNGLFGAVGDLEKARGQEMDREGRLKLVSEAIGRSITSTNDLTRDEASRAIDSIKAETEALNGRTNETQEGTPDAG